MTDYEGFTKCVREVITPRLDYMGFDFSDIGLLPASHFLATPNVDWYVLVLWVKRRVDNQIFEISHKFGGVIKECTDMKSVEELVSRTIQKLEEAITVH